MEMIGPTTSKVVTYVGEGVVNCRRLMMSMRGKALVRDDVCVLMGSDLKCWRIAPSYRPFAYAVLLASLPSNTRGAVL